MKKIIPALALLLISAVVLSTASYAWFSMNTTVTATGMSVTAKVESNLLIAYGEAGTTMKFDSEYGREVKQSVSGILQPVSTVNGVNFFYTQNAKANGDAEEDKYETLTNNTIAINTIDYNGYVDYVFDLKATNTGNDISYIRLSKLNLLYDKAAVTDDKAARVAVFVQEAGAVETDAADTFPTTANVIYTLAGAANFTTGEAVNSTTTLSSVTYNVTTVFEDSMQVLAHSDKYYKVTIRLWIEGEDTTCYSSKFKNLDKAWTLGVEFELTTEDSTVTNIGSTP